MGENVTSNVARLADMNEALTLALGPFVSDNLERTFGKAWVGRARLPAQCTPDQLDGHACLYAIIHNWFDAFKGVLPQTGRSAASSALDGRNAAGHPSPPPSDLLTLRALIGAAEILDHIGAHQELEVVAQHREELIRYLSEHDQSTSSFDDRQSKIPSVPQAIGTRRSAAGSVGAPFTLQKAQNKNSTPVANNGGYWVYENWTNKIARIHVSNCSYCNNGRGIHEDSSTRNGQWFGAYDTRDLALEAAKATGQPDVRACKICAA